jgi:hypothetical protein
MAKSMAKGIYKLGLVFALGLGVALSASGQGRGMAAPGHGFSTPARGVSGPGRVGGQRGGLGTAPGVHRPGLFAPPLVGTPLNPNFAPIRGVPGLGFDFPHLAAIQRPFRDRFGHLRRGLFFSPLFFDSLPLSYPYDGEYPYEEGVPDYYTEAAQQPQFVIPPPQLQPAPPSAETAPRVVTPQAPAPPPPELGQLILVRHDGQVLLAVAFTTNHGQLTYITREGTRRSFPISELDKDATRQMNDANGTSVSLPD